MPRKRRSEDVDAMVTATSPIKIKVEQFIEETASMDVYIPALDRFAEDTSMLGFRYLHTRYKTWFRVLWGFVVVFFIGLTFYQVFERVNYYFIKNPLTTRRSYETLSNMYFPTIGVCNKMQLKASSVASKNPDLLRGMCSVLDETTSNSTRFDELDKFDDVDILDLYRNSIQSVDDLFVSCEFGKSGSCQDEIRPMYTPYGLCYSVSPNKTILRPGPETTLSLVLNLEVHEIIPGTVVEPGVVLSIYDGASSLSHYSEGIHLEAGKVVTIPVNEVRKLRLHESSCGSTKMESFSEKEYSKAACEWSVSVKQIEKECGCIPIRNPIYRGVFDNKNDQVDNSTEVPKKKYKKWKKRKIPRCTLRQEIECVQEKLNIRPHIDDTTCPDDCEDISFSSIVFGGKLSASEIVSMLPSDWEDTKEKRLTAYQKALEVIPNRMIPVVRNVQQLADELQLFVKEASEIFGVSDKFNDVKCLSIDGRSYESFINQFYSYEPTWERITTYLQHSLARELNSTALCLGLVLNDKGEIDDTVTPVVNMTLASIALLQLGQIEHSLGRVNFNYGLTMMHETTRRVVLELAHPLITEVRDCVTKMYDNLERVEEIADDCRMIFKNHYQPLLEASNVHTKTNPSSDSFKTYTEYVKKVLSKLQVMKTRVRMNDWKDFNIDLKEFESLYREIAKDHVEIEEMLKLRKTMVTDIPKLASELSETFMAVTESRRKFAVLTGISADESFSEKFSNFSKCLEELSTKAPILKKSRFIRGEWLSRLRNQVLMAQSYSPTHQYDVVNLLHIKFYFAHFKQETILQERSYNMFLLLAEIGGTIGLYVGATLLTVAETLVFLCERRKSNIFLKPQFV
ncbi:hypothetical protein L5515_008022 [Caenorhabditis briggsae]|uniref:Uncharacterized protein n=1 Tax=Caenorhabditis briggsae TaxID=6238 RepID=A0AAE9F691_CAEBR|nr:hypothetical protein L5515_008022 [Caenorhabditis briggsae]